MRYPMISIWPLTAAVVLPAGFSYTGYLAIQCHIAERYTAEAEIAYIAPWTAG